MVFAGQIPEQLVQQRFPHDFLRGQQREALGEIDFVVGAEIGNGVDAGAALLKGAAFQHQTNQIEIFFHAAAGILPAAPDLGKPLGAAAFVGFFRWRLRVGVLRGVEV